MRQRPRKSGLIPKRFQQVSGLERYFTMARGKEGISALEMTKYKIPTFVRVVMRRFGKV